MEIREKHFLAYVAEKEAVNVEARTIRFVISTNELDRDREIVEPQAVADAIKDFARNPVCLACHQHKLSDGMPPVVGSWDTDSFKQLKSHCEMDLRFATTALAETYWNLYKDKHMRAVSIGFRILDGHEEVKNSVRFYIIDKIELYEISCVPVGANRGALSKLKELGFAEDEAKSLTDRIEKILDMKFEAIMNRLDDIESLHIPGSDDDLTLVPVAKDVPSETDDKGQSALQQIYHALSKAEI